ncbi:hypothetical protein COO60DRAFT_1566494, partial [Scenedesmus sp. NREL 46B-D3]
QDAALATRNGDGHLHVRISQQSVPLSSTPHAHAYSSRHLGGLLPCHTLHRGPAGAAAACHAGRCCGGQHHCRRWRFANPASHSPFVWLLPCNTQGASLWFLGRSSCSCPSSCSFLRTDSCCTSIAGSCGCCGGLPGFLPARRSATCVSSWICSLISSCSWYAHTIACTRWMSTSCG